VGKQQKLPKQLVQTDISGLTHKCRYFKWHTYTVRVPKTTQLMFIVVLISACKFSGLSHAKFLYANTKVKGKTITRAGKMQKCW